MHDASPRVITQALALDVPLGSQPGRAGIQLFAKSTRVVRRWLKTPGRVEEEWMKRCLVEGSLRRLGYFSGQLLQIQRERERVEEACVALFNPLCRGGVPFPCDVFVGV